jgi:hypothetical protein
MLDLGLVQADRTLHSIMYVDGTNLDTHPSALCVAWANANGQGAKILNPSF